MRALAYQGALGTNRHFDNCAEGWTTLAFIPTKG
jgi:hypothetical protein